ncbi:uncharacterized protein BDR25DRAFT_301622 [Lindgomyces ingoldianus]|uniref:Uncharacterized protein n=1 Tax=Lindgomyces ingoldianus TaxID=673940 RepID=A0ACB6R4Q1_9PLEO|nr:uncharacterized protein BDR25DRAFT_301622 [Lindgomyces ingoldianus]KAF2474166.1 hypothetical protein BDR25DRAFT_301622 [Lindgomyces ingoldianus]
MPALFGKDLPPCGLDLQVAYENINLRLRKRWLQNHGYVNVVDTCRSIKSELDRDQRIWPPTQNHSFTKKRRPWRRENVFKRELQWIKYFLREAQAQSPELMTESEILNLSKESPVPLELGLSVSRSDVLKLWNEWNRLKRMPTPAMLDVETGMGLDGLMLNGRVNGEANGSDEVSKVSTDSPSMTAVSTTDSAANGDAQVWSSGGHS